MLSSAAIFTFLFVTLGPLKLIGPFAQRTHALDQGAVRKIAVRATVIGTAAIVVGGFLGAHLLVKWHIEIAALTLASGVIFFLVALRQLLEQYEHASAVAPEPLPAAPTAAALRLVFPTVLTPYGIALVIALLATSSSMQHTATILGLLFGVMLLNLLGMLFARRILSGPMVIVLQLLGAVLGVLQLALSTEFIVTGLRDLGIIAAL